MAITVTTLSAPASASTDTFAVASSAGASVGGFCKVNGEYSTVTAIPSATSVVVRTRGERGGRVLAHTSLSPVSFGLNADLPDWMPGTGDAKAWDELSVSADGALTFGSKDARVNITKGSIAVLTIANPNPLVVDGRRLRIYGRSAFAHTVTYAPGFQQQGAAGDVATFAAGGGGVLELEVQNGRVVVVSSAGVTFA